MGKSHYAIFKESWYSYAFVRKMESGWLLGLFFLGSSHASVCKIAQPAVLSPMPHCHPCVSTLSIESCAESPHPYSSKKVSSELQWAHKNFTSSSSSSCLGHFLVLCECCGSLEHKSGRFWFVTFETSGKSKPELILDAKVINPLLPSELK